MGFLDGIIKSTVRQVVRETVGQAAREAVRDVTKNAIQKATGLDVDGGGDGRPLPSRDGRDGAPRDAAAASGGYAGQGSPAAPGGHTVEYFREILASEFGGYELRENVSPGEIGGVGRPYDFGLYQGGRLVAVVPLAAHNRTNNAAWKNARAAAEGAGVPFVNFHLHMPNQRDFVISRVKRLLG
ncbi:MAG: hypothetical protein LBT74_00555 [Acidobacteriota bacterium]|jgi:hypothetical protein|nr:hypothetical protein [Acidobacteriota bacterium]